MLVELGPGQFSKGTKLLSQYKLCASMIDSELENVNGHRTKSDHYNSPCHYDKGELIER